MGRESRPWGKGLRTVNPIPTVVLPDFSLSVRLSFHVVITDLSPYLQEVRPELFFAAQYESAKGPNVLSVPVQVQPDPRADCHRRGEQRPRHSRSAARGQP